jgi:PTS system N-acetylgalactosamine-specific IIB component
MSRLVLLKGLDAMDNLVLVRIDERLIHGQILTQWLKTTQANLILVANDEISNDPLRQSLMSVAIPRGIQTRFFSIEKTINTIHKASDTQRIMLIVQNSQDLLLLVNGGVPVVEAILGNIHMKEGKRQISVSVAVDDKDVENFKSLHHKNIQLHIQRMPSEAKIVLSELIELC